MKEVTAVHLVVLLNLCMERGTDMHMPQYTCGTQKMTERWCMFLV